MHKRPSPSAARYRFRPGRKRRNSAANPVAALSVHHPLPWLGGIVPAAIEMMDRLAIVAAKAATGVDWPDVGAVLLMDVDGPLAEVEHTSAAAIEMACAAGALEIRRPKDEDERPTLKRRDNQ